MLKIIPGDLKYVDGNHPLAMKYLTLMLNQERHQALALIMEAADAGTSIKNIYMQVFQPVQYEIGWLWQTGRITVGHEHYCTNATQLIISMLYPRLFTASRRGKRVLAVCGSGELHELGLRMVTDFFEMDGWDTDYLGANTPSDSVVAAVEQRQTALLLLSITMAHHLDAARQLISEVRSSDAGENIAILVGGYLLNNNSGLWKKLGPDGTAPDAEKAVALAHSLLLPNGDDKRDE